MKRISTLLALTLFVSTAFAQSSHEADTESIDAIITAVYESISGPAGEERDWDRFRNLFVPDAKLIPVRVTPDTTHSVFNAIEDYIGRVSDYFVQNGFFEVEISRKTEQYGHIAHTFSTYESRRTEEDEQPFARGINSFQLMHDGDRWWVVNIMWDSERPGQEIPAAYLPE